MKADNYIIIVWLFITSFLISCEGNKNLQEQSYVQELNKILEWPPEDGFYSDEVMQSVFDYIRNNPQSLEYEFKDEPQCMRIATSDDGMVRAYSLERSGFGGNPSLGFDCKTMIQYRSGDDVFCKVFDDFNGYITSISQIDSNKYYLLETFQGCIAQGTFETYNFYVYKVENNKLVKVKECFVNRNANSDNLELSLDDYGGRLIYNDMLAIEDSEFIFNKFKKELYVLKDLPKIGESLKYRQYCWNGQRFELKEYDEPKEYRNDEYFIRIEQQSENFWTYKCWNGGEKHGEPDLMIKHGIKQYWLYDNSLISYDEWWTDDASSPNGEKYTFFNNGYRYEYYDGWSNGMQHEELFLYNPQDNLIYSGTFTPVYKRIEE